MKRNLLDGVTLSERHVRASNSMEAAHTAKRYTDGSAYAMPSILPRTAEGQNDKKTRALHFVLAFVFTLTWSLFVKTHAFGQTTAPQSTNREAPASKRAKQEQHEEADKKAAAAQRQKLFRTPEEAQQALVEAAQAKDHQALAALFGPEHSQMLSGDPEDDAELLHDFADHISESCALEKVDDHKYMLAIGAEHYPFSVPIISDGEQWRFDTASGLREILDRRIGEDELSAIMASRAYVVAQWEYFTESGNHNNDGLAEYARKFVSSPGQRDGLYWDTVEEDEPSPSGIQIAAAGFENDGAGRNARGPKPAVRNIKSSPRESSDAQDIAGSLPKHSYHGYFFKILTRQGPNAPGGRLSYLINGHMIAGHAIIAYPDKWGNSGVMTFIVNVQGRVYEKNLGPRTAQIAATMSEYNPDSTWKLVTEE